MNSITIYDWLNQVNTLDDDDFKPFIQKSIHQNNELAQSLFRLLIDGYNKQNFQYFSILLKIIGYLSPLNPQYLYMQAFYDDYSGQRPQDNWDSFDKARVFDPSNLLILHTQANIQQKQGNDGEAIHYYKKLLDSISHYDPKAKDIMYQLHHLYYRNGIYDKAYYYALKYQKTNDFIDDNITYNIQQIYMYFGKFDKINVEIPTYYPLQKYWKTQYLTQKIDKNKHVYIRLEGSITAHIIGLYIILMIVRTHHVHISVSLDYPWLMDLLHDRSNITYYKNHLKKLDDNINFYGYFNDLLAYFYRFLYPTKTSRQPLFKTEKQQKKQNMIISICQHIILPDSEKTIIIDKPDSIDKQFIDTLAQHRAIISDDADIIMIANVLKIPCFALCMPPLSSAQPRNYILANHNYLPYFGKQQQLHPRLAFEDDRHYIDRLNSKIEKFYRQYAS